MARACSVCGRGALNSIRRSHSNIANVNKQQVNLQTLLFRGKRVVACTSCIRRETKRLKEISQPQNLKTLKPLPQNSA